MITTREWQPPDVSDDATTADLATIHASFWAWIEETHGADAPELKSRPEISRENVERLLRLAFLASLATDEQRQTRGNLYIPATSEARMVRIVRLDPVEPIQDQKVIAKLCPTLGVDDAVLVVRQEAEELACVEIACLDDQHANYQLLRLPHEWIGNRGGILVSIVAPGEIRLRQGYCDYSLRGNKIIPHTPASDAPQVTQWLTELHRSVLQQLPEEMKTNELRFLDDSSPSELKFLLSRILETAARLRHGATVVVLQDPHNAPFETVTYRTSGDDLLRRVVQLYGALAEAFQKRDQKGGTDAIDRYEHQRHLLLTKAEGLGRLAATDGCVVFNRDLGLHGFGGIINIDRARQDSRGTDRTLVDHCEEELLRDFGTRHRSAFYLCKACPNAIAFVMSQDGDVRVFASDDLHVFFRDNLSP